MAKRFRWWTLFLAMIACGAIVQAELSYLCGKPKDQRQRELGLIFRNYRPDADPGGDMADAIELGRWWFIEGRQPK